MDTKGLECQTARIESHVPARRKVQVAEHRGGCFTMATNRHFLAEPAPELRGFWMAVGCNGTGFSISPAIGHVLAGRLVGGVPSIDLRHLAPARFADAARMDDELTAAGVWQYAHYSDPGQ